MFSQNQRDVLLNIHKYPAAILSAAGIFHKLLFTHSLTHVPETQDTGGSCALGKHVFDQKHLSQEGSSGQRKTSMETKEAFILMPQRAENIERKKQRSPFQWPQPM